MKRRITQLSLVVGRARRIRNAIVGIVVVSMLAGCGPSDPIQAARQQMVAGDLDGSLESLRELLKTDSQNPELLFLYGRVLYTTGQPGLAEWPLRKAMQDPLWFERAARLLAASESAGGNYENAAKLYAEILDANPDDLEIRIKRANVCAQTPALFEEALAEVDQILERAPDELGAFKPRILAYLGMNRPEEAGLALEELGVRIAEGQGDDSPINGWHCATSAIFASDSGDKALASERWAVCEEKYPTHPNVVSQSIEFHKSQGDLQRALEVAEAAFAADPDPGAGYRLTTAGLLRQLGRLDEAESLLLEGSDQSESVVDQAAALLALTEHYKNVGKIEAAADALDRALAISQESIGPQPDLLFALADLLIQSGEVERASGLSGQMSVAAHRSLIRARVAHERKQYTRALKLYAETSRLWPENPYAPYHEARAAMAAGLFDRAFQSYLLSTRVDETATDARFQAALLLRAEGKLVTALELIGSTRVARSAEAELVMIDLVARTRATQAAVNSINQMSQRYPQYFGEAVAAAARGASEREDSQDAWMILEPILALELPPVNYFPVLRAAVRYAPGDEELAVVKPLVERAVETYPDAAQISEIEAMLFERAGAQTEAVASYRRALELDPGRVTVLLSLARMIAGAQPDEGLELIERALQMQMTSLQPFEPDLFLAAVSQLPASPGVDVVLESALEWAPANGQIAYRLALNLESQGGEAERIVRLATRAIRFQAGDQATELRDRAKKRL
jgi:tetratricopeptide (TPR) repeat protein